MHVRVRPAELESWRVGLIWKNAGQTPAQNVRARINVDTFPIGLSPESTNFTDIGQFDDVSNPLGPNQSFSSSLEVPLQKWVDAWEGRAALYYWAWIEYDGININTRHRTEVCSELVPKSDPRERDDFKVIDKVSTRFNAMDAECVHQPKTNQREPA